MARRAAEPKPHQVNGKEAAFYGSILSLLNRRKIPYLVGGAFAVNSYTGMNRNTKDVDIFCRAGDYPRILKAAADGANIAIAAKTVEPHPKLEGTIHTAAAEIAKAGGRALPLAVDVRDDAAVQAALDETAEKFGGIDIVVNNASAIQLTSVAATEMRRYDLMQQINARGTFMVSKFAIPYLVRAENPHILMLSPPLDMAEKWFAPHAAYSMAKFGMSLVVLGLAGELRGKVAVNALWPRTIIATAAIKNLLGGDTMMRMSRKPEILAEAAYRVFQKPKSFTGNFLIDDTFLAGEGVTDFDQYRADPSQPLQVDFFVPDKSPPPSGVSLNAKSR